MVVDLEFLVSGLQGNLVLISTDSRRFRLLGIDRTYGAKVLIEKRRDVAKGRNARRRVHCWELGPLNSRGQETLGRSFLLWFGVFPSFLHQLECMAGGGGVGCLCCFKLVSKAILLKVLLS